MNEVIKKVLCYFIFPLAILGFVYLIVNSVMEPVTFNKQRAARETVAVQRLKDIRTLQVAFKSVNNRFTSSIDSLKDFYENGKMVVTMRVGSSDDSLAVANTERIKRQRRGIKPAELYKMYLAGERNLVFSVDNEVAVKDTLFKGRRDFNIDSLYIIPFSGGQKVEMSAVIKIVSGVPVPLFEAKMPYKALLKGLDNQLRINLDSDNKDQNKFEGLQVGSITAPNNNAGNWE
ncbi:MAG: hypothetical protein ACTTGX_04685 [Candidatus Cryptobacteroides sp.]